MSATITTRLDVEIARPAEAVWAVVSDYPSDTRWRKGITEMTPDREGAPAVGTRIREVLQLAGKTYVSNTTVTEVGPEMHYRFEGEGTAGGVRGGRTVVPTGPNSAVFTYEVEVDPTALPRLARPLLSWMFERGLSKDLDRLRTLIESDQLTSTAVG